MLPQPTKCQCYRRRMVVSYWNYLQDETHDKTITMLFITQLVKISPKFCCSSHKSELYGFEPSNPLVWSFLFFIALSLPHLSSINETNYYIFIFLSFNSCWLNETNYYPSLPLILYIYIYFQSVLATLTHPNLTTIF